MRTVFLLFDSLNRHMLSPYGGTKIATPNFERLAQRSLTFDKHYVGSMPCMPARRDMHTGRLNFLHRSWGPLEPFDNSFPMLLAASNVYSHLITDHHHYFEDGGSTYHNRYDSYEFVRGQEGDRWKGLVSPDWDSLSRSYHPAQFSTARRNYRMNNVLNREYIEVEADFPARQCIDKGVEFITANRSADDWLLQIETFSPHEPFHAPSRFRPPYETGWNGPVRDWPRYGPVEESDAEANELRASYYSTVAFCDELLGRVLDEFDRNDMWKDTALIVTTDHGFLLGEHDFWAKNRSLLYEEIGHIPLFLHDPARPSADGERTSSLTQTIDLAPTILDLHDSKRPTEMQGISLRDAYDHEGSFREAIIYGYFAGAVNVTDGNWSYHRYPEDLAKQKIWQYTVMPTHMMTFFSPAELASAELVEGFSFCKGARLLRMPLTAESPMYLNPGPGSIIEKTNRLYDLRADPIQLQPVENPAVEHEMLTHMLRLMKENEAPAEAFDRIGTERPH